MISEYLEKLQDLQRKSLGTNIQIEIETRYDEVDKYPWLIVCVSLNGWTKMEDVPREQRILSLQIYGNMYGEEELNEQHQAERYDRIVKWLEAHNFEF